VCSLEIQNIPCYTGVYKSEFFVLNIEKVYINVCREISGSELN